MLILCGGFNVGELNVWKYEGKTILDKFLLRVNIGGEIVWRFFTCTETIGGHGPGGPPPPWIR